MVFALLFSLAISSGYTAHTAEADTVKGSLTLTKAIPDTGFSLYQIQVKNEDGTFTTTKDFAKYPIDLKLTDASQMRSAAITLYSYIIADKPKAFQTAKADAKGVVTFKDLLAGLYVAVGESKVISGARTDQAPVIAFIPATGEDQKEIYDLTAEVKTEIPKSYTSYKVLKIWKDNESTARPKSIEVSLLKDGKEVKKITLSKANNWEYTWDKLEEGHKYSVKELTKLSGYTVNVSEDKGVFSITNTKTTPTPTPTSPPRGTTPRPSTPGSSPKLPQTGQPWWPVFVLTAMGLFFILLGMTTRERRK